MHVKFNQYHLENYSSRSFIFAMYKWFEADNFDLYAIPDEYGTKTIRHSYLERKWVLQKYEEYKRPETFVSLHTCNISPRIGRCSPDYAIYYEDKMTLKEVGLFQGIKKRMKINSIIRNDSHILFAMHVAFTTVI